MIFFDQLYSNLGMETHEQLRNLRKFGGREREGEREEGAGEEENRELEFRMLTIFGRELIRGHTSQML